MADNTPQGFLGKIEINATILPQGSIIDSVVFEFRIQPNLNWTRIENFGSTVSNPVVYFTENCGAELIHEFRITIFSIGCEVNSNILTKEMRDDIAPSIPQIRAVSVDTTTNRSVVTWLPTPEPDTRGYNIVRLVGGATNIIGQNIGQLNTTYLYAASNAGNVSELFSVQSFDECIPANTSPTNPDFHRSMYLTVNTNFCERENLLSWTPYQNWDTGVEIYEIYVGENDFALSLLGTSTSPNFVHPNIGLFSSYCYVIKALKADDNVTSLSNKACVSSAVTDEPVFAEIRKILSQENGVFLEVGFDAAGASGANTFLIERSTDNVNFIQVGQLPGLLPVESFIDATADPLLNYRYRLVILDACGLPIVVSNTLGNIVLNGIIDDGLENVMLSWMWNSQFLNTSFILEKLDEDLNEFVVLDILENQTEPFTYTHDISDLDEVRLLCFKVSATSTAGFQVTSNIACVDVEPLVFTPNAYLVGGNSIFFKPIVSFADTEGYEFKVLNRIGQTIFITNSLNEGWDGKFRGELVQQGIYIWQATMQSGSGKRFQKSGKVTLIR